MTSAQLGDVTIEYEVDGPDDGAPILLLMGLGCPAGGLADRRGRGPRRPRLPRHPDGQQGHRAVDEDRGSGADPGRAVQGLRAPAVRAGRSTCCPTWRPMPWPCSTTSASSAAHVVGRVDGRDDRPAADHRPPRPGAQPVLDHVEHRRPAARQRLAAPAPHRRDVDVGAAAGGPRRGRAARGRGVPADRRPALRRRRDRRHGAHGDRPQRQPAGHDPAAGRHPGQPRPHGRAAAR